MKRPDRFTPEDITELLENEVFVFGSNLAGMHGGGAARVAAERFDAIRGQGVGHFGRSYAIPTKDERGGTLAIDEIGDHVRRFLIYADSRRDLTFFVTQIGCGLAGYSPEEIGPLFRGAPANVVLPRAFWNTLEA